LPDFFESKQLHLRAQIRQLLCDALVEKEDVNQNEWYMIRDNQQIHLVNQIPVCLISSSTIKVEYDEEEGYTEAENELQVGDDVQVDNISGQLMCSSKMGVDCLDLLNHVLTDENDMRAFLGSENCDEVWTWLSWKIL